MFHYQVGSLEEEPPVLAARLVERGLRTAAVLFDQSPVGRRYFEAFEGARARLGIEVTGSASISPLSEDADELLARLRAGNPDALVYFGLGVSSRAVSLARESLGWDVPVLSNSALMFGYARPDWRDGYAGWEYLDNIADDNKVRVPRCASAVAARGGRPDRLRRLRHGPPARRSRRPGRAPHPGRDRRRAAQGEVHARARAATTARSWASATGTTPR